uniref:Cell division cycle associated 3 n=1 Tax=Myotis myotis TaxID=51298 RepID=A0A7J7Z1V1_MYOMY|nr:cell division cycle associated 3 [Myotis myotis]
MGSAKSVLVTPARPPPHNKLLARVADPRSPSAGILRTPIQVESSPQPNRAAGEQLEDANQAQDSDPRSPTLGIARTPMKTSSGELTTSLVKELSEEFESEAPKSNLPPEPVLPLEVFSEEETGQPSETLRTSQGSDKPIRDPETPRPSGSKRNRRKPRGKALGRSPLTILQDDNSPGTRTLRQGKRPSPLSENVRELKDGAILGTGRLLRTGGQAWEQGQDHDKENQHFALAEN